MLFVRREKSPSFRAASFSNNTAPTNSFSRFKALHMYGTALTDPVLSGQFTGGEVWLKSNALSDPYLVVA